MSPRLNRNLFSGACCKDFQYSSVLLEVETLRALIALGSMKKILRDDSPWNTVKDRRSPGMARTHFLRSSSAWGNRKMRISTCGVVISTAPRDAALVQHGKFKKRVLLQVATITTARLIFAVKEKQKTAQ